MFVKVYFVLLVCFSYVFFFFCISWINLNYYCTYHFFFQHHHVKLGCWHAFSQWRHQHVHRDKNQKLRKQFLIFIVVQGQGFWHTLREWRSVSTNAKGFSVFCYVYRVLSFSVDLLSIVSELRIKKVKNHCRSWKFWKHMLRAVSTSTACSYAKKGVKILNNFEVLNCWWKQAKVHDETFLLREY